MADGKFSKKSPLVKSDFLGDANNLPDLYRQMMFYDFLTTEM